MTAQVLPKDRSLSKIVARSETLDRVCKYILVKKLSDIKTGYLVIKDPHTTHTFGDKYSPITANVTIHNMNFYSRTVLGGSIGNAESYVDSDWEVDQLTNFIRIFVLNRHIVEGVDGGLGKILQPFQKIIHGLKSNTIKGSRENIKAHYDIGNNFFELFLDKTMMYSSAIFKDASSSLEEASLNKIRIVCENLKLKATDHLVEIGTGWGSLAIYAAENYGCKVTTTTISQEQYDFTLQKIKEKKLENRITILFEDYRNLSGTFDKLVSIEMIEAVGLDNLDTYFKKCSSLVKENGLLFIQAITIRDHYYEKAKTSVDFIQRHIFPGSGIPSVSAIMDSIKENTDLVLIEQKDFAEDYAQTLHHWSKNLEVNKEQITNLGYPAFLYRLWQFYFSYCEGGFRERAIGLSHLLFSKPLYKDRSYKC
jgi:cyclopropane-fatty-acyl-phospholipid synthase